jgi:hypothetical protein
MKNAIPLFRYVALLMLFIQSSLSLAQYGYFEQGYGTDKNEEGFDVITTADYKVMMAGYLQHTTHKDIYLVYTDSIGDTLWTKTLGDGNDDVATALWQKDASSWFSAGYTQPTGSNNFDISFVKFDATGQILINTALGTADDNFAFDMAQCHDGNMVIVGYSTISGSKDIYVLKVDSATGTVLWSNHYGGTGNQEAKAVLTKSNGNIVITGTDYNGGLPQAFLLELDSTGTQLIYQTLSQTFSSYIHSIAMTRNGKYWLAGYTDNGTHTDAFIALVDANGFYEIHETYGGSGDDKFNSILRIGNALFMCGSTQSYGEGGSDLYFVAADSVGNLLFDEYGGGTNTDYANAMFHRNGLLYLTGYNSSFGITESGNMYAARFNVYDLAGVIMSTNDLQTLVPVAADCTMPRILYSDKMLGTTNSDTLRIYGYDFCMHCSGTTINEADITGGIGFYEGIIGNPYRENELLEFCQTHGFNSIYFYGSGYLFSKAGSDINTNYTVNLTGGGSQNLITYLNEKLYDFIVRAKLNYGVQHVGIAGGDLPHSPHTENIFFRTGDFNSFQSSLQNYNYKHTGKVGQIVLEDEFWRTNDNLSGYSQTDTFFNDHKLYLKRMLTVARNDFNIRSVDDYIGRLLGDGLSWFQFDSCTRANNNVKGLIQQRASELEELKDTLLNRKRLNRIFMVYATATRYPTNKEQTSAPWFSSYNCHNPGVSHCDCPDLFNDIGGVDNDCYEDSILPSLP